jgi:phosphoglycolate phosphatase-like HAD superfamily hydrolase
VGLWSRFPFGGFGSDAEERVDVLRAGHRKAEAWLGYALSPGDVVIIGDTPRDIAAAHAAGFCCVAVATGRHSVHELADSGGDLVLASLAEPDAAERVFRCVRR